MINSRQFVVRHGIKCYHPELAEDFDSYPSAGFDVTDDVETSSFWVASRTRLLKREVLKAVSGIQHARFFEIGCGTGAFLRSLSSANSFKLLGSEIYLRGLLSATSRSKEVEFIQLDATDIPFDSEFHAIGAFDVIEHVDDDIAILQGIWRALKPGGTVILTVPQHQFLWSSLDEFVHHRRRYSRKDLVDKLESVGFQVTYTTSFVFVLFPLMLVSRVFFGRSKNQPSAAEFDKQVRFNPITNRLFDWLMRIDEAMITRGWSLPFGGSLLVVARKTLLNHQ
jgi:SAM-dependent methyltransferase